MPGASSSGSSDGWLYDPTAAHDNRPLRALTTYLACVLAACVGCRVDETALIFTFPDTSPIYEGTCLEYHDLDATVPVGGRDVPCLATMTELPLLDRCPLTREANTLIVDLFSYPLADQSLLSGRSPCYRCPGACTLAQRKCVCNDATLDSGRALEGALSGLAFDDIDPDSAFCVRLTVVDRGDPSDGLSGECTADWSGCGVAPGTTPDGLTTCILSDSDEPRGRLLVPPRRALPAARRPQAALCRQPRDRCAARHHGVRFVLMPAPAASMTRGL